MSAGRVAGGGEGGLHLGDAQGAEVEDGGGEHGVGAGVDRRRRSARRAPAPPRAITGIDDRARGPAGSARGRSRPVVPSASIALSRISPAPSSAAAARPTRRRRGRRLCGRRAWSPRSRESVPAARRASTESTSTWLPNRSAISATSSGRWIAAVLTATLSAPARSSRSTSSTAADSPADGQRDEHLLGGARDDLQRGRAALVGGGDVEEGQLVGALGVVHPGQLDRVAGVAQVAGS